MRAPASGGDTFHDRGAEYGTTPATGTQRLSRGRQRHKELGTVQDLEQRQLAYGTFCEECPPLLPGAHSSIPPSCFETNLTFP